MGAVTISVALKPNNDPVSLQWPNLIANLHTYNLVPSSALKSSTPNPNDKHRPLHQPPCPCQEELISGRCGGLILTGGGDFGAPKWASRNPKQKPNKKTSCLPQETDGRTKVTSVMPDS